MLKVYTSILPEKNDLRWRIEHAQVVSPEDFYLFKKFSIIPSVQPTHATSDMYWAKDRLGPVRMKTAYAYQELIKVAGLVADGSDFPVESVNPILGFYAAVSRKDVKGFPENGFQFENALTRQQALYGMTIWAAYSNFEESEKGSISKGKFADFVVLDRDIMKVDEKDIPGTNVYSTYIGGVKVK
jgi:predicted amidohydrolase YtcJ